MIDWRGLGKAFLFFWFFPAFCQGLLLTSRAIGFVPIRLAFVASLIWLLPLLIFPRSAKPIAAVIGVILWLGALVNLGYYAIYGQEFSQSVLFIVFESNPTEYSEYLGQYFAWWMIPAAIAFSACAFWLWRRIRPLEMRPAGRLVILLTVAGIFLLPPTAKVTRRGFSTNAWFKAITSRLESVVPWQFAIGFASYQEQLSEMENLMRKSESIPPVANLIDLHADESRTLVLVIG